MIYITGDCHGDYTRFSSRNFPEQKEMTKNDYVIICGDFGYWNNSNEQKYWRNWLDNKPFTTLFIDGNHENFDMLNQMSIEQWNGGNVHRISDSIIHLMRGQVFTIEDQKFFTFGGARSHDIKDGILNPSDKNFKEKYKKMQERHASFRINHVSWWEEEMPNETEMQQGREVLEQNDWEVDFIITHCAPSSVQAIMSMGLYAPDALTNYFEEIRQKCKYSQWFFGHYHKNALVDSRNIAIYKRIERIV